MRSLHSRFEAARSEDWVGTQKSGGQIYQIQLKLEKDGVVDAIEGRFSTFEPRSAFSDSKSVCGINITVINTGTNCTNQSVEVH